MPINSITPAASYIFRFEKVGMQDNTGTIADMPDIGDVTISFLLGEEPAGGTSVVGGVKTVVKKTSDILGGVSPSSWGNGEGVYVYDVYEQEDTNSFDPAKEEESYSKAGYRINISVILDDDGDLVVDSVVMTIIEGFEDEYYVDAGLPQDGKVEELIFSNRYWKTSGGGETVYNLSALDIIKAVVGSGGDQDKYFTFDIKVIQPSIINKPADAQGNPIPRQYIAYVVQVSGTGQGTVVTDGNNFDESLLQTDRVGNKFILFTSDVALTVRLKHGQKLAFVDLHTGSAVEVQERAEQGYKASYMRTFSRSGMFTSTSENSNWGFPWGVDPSREDPGPHYTRDNPNVNTAAFTNTRSSTAVTGISDDQLLPYSLLAVCGVMGLMAIVFRKRRAK